MSSPKLLNNQTLSSASIVAVANGEYKVAEPSAKEVQYFSSTEGIVHVFDFDYDLVQDYQVKLGNANASCGAICCIPLCWYACGKQNTIDAIHAQHVAITVDGIRFVKDTRKQGCRMECDKAGKTTKTIPFDKLTDCDIEEPAGASGPLCCMVKNTLTKVNIDTASSGMQVNPQNGAVMNTHELQLIGLKDPHGFKSMVWRMKRSGAGNVGATSAPQQMGMSRNNDDIVRALTSQNSILKEQNTLLLQIVKNTSK